MSCPSKCRIVLRITALSVALASVVAAACSFPDPSLADLDRDDAGGADGGLGDLDAAVDTNGDASLVDSDALVDGGFVVTVDGSNPDELIVDDAGQKVDAGPCPPSDCDCDNDGYFDYSRAECADAGGALRDGGDPTSDCDDFDRRTHPNQGFLDIPAEAPRNGDWNCKNGVERLFPYTNVTCSGLALSGCKGTQGFSGTPGCGVEAEYVFCQPTELLPGVGLSCGIGSKTTQTQACK